MGNQYRSKEKRRREERKRRMGVECSRRRWGLTFDHFNERHSQSPNVVLLIVFHSPNPFRRIPIGCAHYCGSLRTLFWYFIHSTGSTNVQKQRERERDRDRDRYTERQRQNEKRNKRRNQNNAFPLSSCSYRGLLRPRSREQPRLLSYAGASCWSHGDTQVP